jgi:hypothetical protein
MIFLENKIKMNNNPSINSSMILNLFSKVIRSEEMFIHLVDLSFVEKHYQKIIKKYHSNL